MTRAPRRPQLTAWEHQHSGRPLCVVPRCGGEGPGARGRVGCPWRGGSQRTAVPEQGRSARAAGRGERGLQPHSLCTPLHPSQPLGTC